MWMLTLFKVFLPSFVFNNWDNISYKMFAVLIEEMSETHSNYYMYINYLLTCTLFVHPILYRLPVGS